MAAALRRLQSSQHAVCDRVDITGVEEISRHAVLNDLWNAAGATGADRNLTSHGCQEARSQAFIDGGEHKQVQRGQHRFQIRNESGKLHSTLEPQLRNQSQILVLELTITEKQQDRAGNNLADPCKSANEILVTFFGDKLPGTSDEASL